MTVSEKAYAKINLFLDVTGRRDDGYHNIDTVMQSVSLCDDITITAVSSDKIEINISSNDKTLELGESNLIYKSALKYVLYFGIRARMDVKLTKRIPIGAGLGGGSSDAAATLRAMNRIYGLATKEQLYEMAAEIGSDVPFCIDGGCAFCSGKGEKIRPYKVKLYRNIVIAIGESRVSTPRAYALLDEKYGDFRSYNEEKSFSDNGCPTLYYNIFESVIDSREISNIKEVMKESGAKFTLMSGSGPSVYGVFCNGFSASLAKTRLNKQGFFAVKCRPVSGTKENI